MNWAIGFEPAASAENCREGRRQEAGQQAGGKEDREKGSEEDVREAGGKKDREEGGEEDREGRVAPATPA